MPRRDRPTLVCCRTHIAEGSPNKQDTSAAHGAPLGDEEIALTKAALGWPEDETFLVPDDVAAHMHAAGTRGRADREAWEAAARPAVRRTRSASPGSSGSSRATWPADWAEAAAGLRGRSLDRDAQGLRCRLAALGDRIPELIGGSCDLAGSNNTTLPGAKDVARDAFDGRTLHFGVREHAMGAVMNGMALHGGIRPYGGTFLVFSDYMRASIRLAALMKLPSSTCSRTTPSASAKTGPRTSRSSTWPPCVPCPVSP